MVLVLVQVQVGRGVACPMRTECRPKGRFYEQRIRRSNSLLVGAGSELALAASG
jgi:hypothetical protein